MTSRTSRARETADDDAAVVYGDNAYGTGEFQDAPRRRRHRVALQDPGTAHHAGGLFTKDRFDVDLDDDTRDLSGRRDRRRSDGTATASAWPTSATPAPRARCAAQCTNVDRRAHDRDRRRTKRPWPGPGPARPTRPGAPTTGPHVPRSSASSPTSCDADTAGGGPGCAARREVDADFSLLAAAANLARLAVLGVAN